MAARLEVCLVTYSKSKLELKLTLSEILPGTASLSVIRPKIEIQTKILHYREGSSFLSLAQVCF